MKEAEELKIYLVGSCERKFIVDQVHYDKESAIAYCNSRRNSKYPWVVEEATPPSSYLNWEVVHRVEVKDNKS